jgi:hypothetical protein
MREELDAFQAEVGALRELKEREDEVYREEIRRLRRRVAELEAGGVSGDEVLQENGDGDGDEEEEREREGKFQLLIDPPSV